MASSLQMWRFALFAGLSFTLPAFLIAYTLGPEFPSLFAGLFGLILVTLVAKKGYLIPKQIWKLKEEPTEMKDSRSPQEELLRTRDSRSPREELLAASDVQERNGEAHVAAGPSPMKQLDWRKAWVPYFVLTLLLIISRLDMLPFKAWPMVAPFVGALGSSISGSATFSNMMFSLLQFSVAEQVQLAPEIILALQLLGSNAGNMICILNVVAAASVVGLLGKEGKIIRYTMVPMLFYAVFAGVVSIIFLIGF